MICRFLRIPLHNVQAFLHRLLMQRGDQVARKTRVICKNIFKSGNEKEFRKEYTKRWIELMNRRERGRGRTSVWE